MAKTVGIPHRIRGFSAKLEQVVSSLYLKICQLNKAITSDLALDKEGDLLRSLMVLLLLCMARRLACDDLDVPRL